MYFPQFQIAVEIDEDYHSKKNQIQKDQLRERAIVDASRIKTIRINIKDKTITEIFLEIQQVVDFILAEKEKRIKTGEFEPYSYGDKYDISRFIRRRKIQVDDDARFRTIVDVIRIFGKEYNGYQQAIFKYLKNCYVWFPKLYLNNDWDNMLLDDGKKIQMRPKNTSKLVALNKPKKSSESVPEKPLPSHCLVFAHYRDIFGQTYYTFKGLFEVNHLGDHKVDYYRISDSLMFKEDGSVDDVFLEDKITKIQQTIRS